MRGIKIYGDTQAMKKRIYVFFMTSLLLLSLSGCRRDTDTSGENNVSTNSGKVELLVWGAAEDEELLNRIIEDFRNEYRGQAEFDITFAAQSESSCTDVLMGGLEEGADVFTFADDQLNTLVAAGALTPIENDGTIRSANILESVRAASVANTLYAYPLTADNGYFLYYNKQYFSEEDISTLDRILEIAAENDRLFFMDWSSGWYVYSMFGNTGLEVGLNNDGITNFCTWNGTDGDIKGIDVASAMQEIAENPGFLSGSDEVFLKGIQDGTIIAGVSGVWNAVAIEKAWGADYGASKLPSYTCAGRQIQMASFSGYKLIGVNAYSRHHEWASRLAEWITNEANQELRFRMRGQGPSNIQAAASDEVQNSPAIAALLEQSEFSCLQRIGGNYWEPVTAFTANLLAGNPSGEGLQEQLDRMVEEITAL